MSLAMAHASNRRRLNGLLLVSALVLAVSACATSRAMRAGQNAEHLEEYDRAIVEYTKVLRAHPENRTVRQALERVKLRASLDHFTRGRRFHSGGRLNEAAVELQLAAEMNPGNQEIEQALSEVRAELRNKVAVAREGKTELESLIERTRNLPPTGFELPSDVRLPESMTFARDTPARDVFTALARFANISVVFDPQFRDQPVSIDLRNTSLESALQSLTAVTRTFYRITAQRTITIVPDTAAKRARFNHFLKEAGGKDRKDIRTYFDLIEFDEGRLK